MRLQRLDGLGRAVPAILFSVLTILTLVSPTVAVRAATAGLALWWDAVLPALLPFFILSEILLSLGVVHWLGTLIDPLMRPLFNVPGPGGFALAMGLSSGYPMGPRLAARLTKDGLIDQVEGERLAAFTNCAGPLFITGAVAVGIFGEPELALPLALAHYAAAIATGLIMRFWGRRSGRTLSSDHRPEIPRASRRPRERLLARAYRAFAAARASDSRPFGQMLSDAVRDGVNTLLAIGGFIVVFSVATAILSRFGIVALLESPLRRLLVTTGASPSLAKPIIHGILEVTSGSGALAKAPAPLWERALAESGVLAWAGFCVHSQARSSPGASLLRYSPFLLGRIVQATLAVVFTAVLLGPLHRGAAVMRSYLAVPSQLGYGASFLSTLRLASMWLIALVALGLLCYAVQTVRQRFSIIIFRTEARAQKPPRH